MYKFSAVNAADVQSFGQRLPNPKISCAPHLSSKELNAMGNTLSPTRSEAGSIESDHDLLFYKSSGGRKEYTSMQGYFAAEEIGRIPEHMPCLNRPLGELLAWS
jgi:hypothetical protein